MKAAMATATEQIEAERRTIVPTLSENSKCLGKGVSVFMARYPCFETTTFPVVLRTGKEF